MAQWVSLVADAAKSSPTIEYNSVGPYYHDGWTYFFHSMDDRIRALRSQDSEAWLITGAASNPVYQAPAHPGSPIGDQWTCAEYEDGGTHKLYVYVSTRPAFPGMEFDLWEFDFPTNTWTLIEPWASGNPTEGTGGIFNAAGRGQKSYGTLAPFNLEGNVGRRMMMRVDQSTGIIYMFHGGAGSPTTCSGTPFTQPTLIYSTYSAGVWSAGGSYPVPSTTIANVVQAFVDDGTRYVITSRILVETPGDPCANRILPIKEFKLYINEVEFPFTPEPFIMNNPACVPFDEPDRVVHQPAPEGSAIAKPFRVNGAYGWISNFVKHDGHIYFAYRGPNKTLVLAEINASGIVSLTDSGEEVGDAPASPGGYAGGGAAYNQELQLGIVNSQLVAMWCTKHPSTASFWEYIPNSVCGSSQVYSSSLTQFVDYKWAVITGGMLGPVQTLTTSTFSNTPGARAGVMPSVFSQNGSIGGYIAGRMTLVVWGSQQLKIPLDFPGGVFPSSRVRRAIYKINRHSLPGL